MTIEQLRSMHQARPFIPFEIHLADGRSIPVDHPEFVSQTASGRTIGVAVDNDAIEVVDLLLVTGLRPLRGGGRKSGRQRPQ
jgi:hypothetical protein